MTPTTPDHAVLHQLEDELLKLKCHLSRAVQQWNIKLVFCTACIALEAHTHIEGCKISIRPELLSPWEIIYFGCSCQSKPSFFNKIFPYLSLQSQLHNIIGRRTKMSPCNSLDIMYSQFGLGPLLYHGCSSFVPVPFVTENT